MNKRLAFMDTREITKQELLVVEKLNQYPNTVDESLLVLFCSTMENQLCERDIRKIIGMYNNRKFLNIDNKVKFHKYNGCYHKIEKDNKKAKVILNKIKFNAISALTTYKIYLEDFGLNEDDSNSLQISMIDKLLNSANIEEEQEC